MRANARYQALFPSGSARNSARNIHLKGSPKGLVHKSDVGAKSDISKTEESGRRDGAPGKSGVTLQQPHSSVSLA